MTDLRPIRTEADYDAALLEVRALWGAELGTPRGDRLDVLTILVDDYESEYHAIDLPDPIAAIRIRMEDLGIDRVAFGRMLGVSSGRVSEILNRRRKLTTEMIRVLATELGLSEKCLLQSYDLATSTRIAHAQAQDASA